LARRLTKILTTTAVTTVGVALFFQGWVLFESRERALRVMATRAENRAQSTADGVESVFRRLDLALLAIRDGAVPDEIIDGPNDATRSRDAAMHRLLLQWQERTPEAMRLHVVSAKGSFVYSTKQPVPTVPLDDRPYFLEQRSAETDELRLTESYYSRVGHEWALFASRRLQTADGRFAGIVMAAVEAASLKGEMTAVDQSQWFLATFDRNRLLVASSPMKETWKGKSFGDALLRTGLETGRSSAHGRALGIIEGPHLWATRRVGSLPLLTVAGVSESIALAQWRYDLRLNLVVAGLLLVGCLGILVVQRRNDRAADDIRDLNERMKLATNSVRLGVWECDFVANRVTVDEATTGLFGLLPGQSLVSCDEWLSLVIPEDRARLRQVLAASTVDPFDVRVRSRISDSELRYLKLNGLVQRDSDGQLRRALGVVWDVTRDELVAHQLQASEEYFRTLFDAVPQAVAVIEAGAVVDCNRPYREIFEIEATETRLPWLLAPDYQGNGATSRAAGERLYEGALSGVFQQVNWRCRRSSGVEFDAELRVTLFPHEGRQLVVVTVRDLTEQRSMEEKLHQAQKLDALGQLAGGVAHDFNNMLAAILASAELMSPEEPQEVQQELRDTIVTAAERAAKLTSKLLAFARKGKVRSTPTDAHGILRETVSLLERTIDRRITIALELEAERSTVIGDPSQLQSALLNLGVNARDAMPQGGTLVIATQNRRLFGSECTLGAFCVSPGAYLCITVADTGHGMTPEVVQHAFDPFFTTKETGKGTGLGLAAVFGTMASHHGAVTVESAVGKGSRFTLYLPVSQEDALPARTEVEPPIKGSGLVLVVDDEELVRTATVMQLESLGYSALALGDPEQIMEVFLAHQGQLVAVLLDMVMPKVMGLDVAARLRQVDSSVPLVLISGFPKTSQLEQWLGKTIDSFLQKPFNQAELGRTLAAVRDAHDKAAG
jgi:PAS domain S-box-containing protein